ncbi:MAG: hypothetical protein HY364_02850 [Candidatus Aenigmarchaeota archaeon]|nr:hypothetical protein [Candidatus Aenigmarchaeota archaeon]HLD84029.1 hypothetical protein [archaeon]
MVKIDLNGLFGRNKSSAPRADAAYETPASGVVYGPAVPDSMRYTRAPVVQVVPDNETGITLNLREKAYMGLANSSFCIPKGRVQVTVLDVERHPDRFRIHDSGWVLNDQGVYERLPGETYGSADLLSDDVDVFGTMKGYLHHGSIHPETKAHVMAIANAVIERATKRNPHGPYSVNLTYPWKYASLVDAIGELPENSDLPAPLRE